MAKVKSITELYLQEEVKADIITNMIEDRKRSISALINDNDNLRERVRELERRIDSLEDEIVHGQQELTNNGEGLTTINISRIPGHTVDNLENTVCNILTDILPPKPHSEQIRAYLQLLGQSKAKNTFAKFMGRKFTESFE